MILQPPGVTSLLAAWRSGDDRAGTAVFELVYQSLHDVAERCLRAERPGHTLHPTALVHEAYLRLVQGDAPPASDRAHLLAIAARSMRQILVNHALRRRRDKRGGGWRRRGLEPALLAYEERCVDVLLLDEALDRLARLDERQARVVELRFFGGLTVPEIARMLDVTPRTVERDWSVARAWLKREVTP